MMIRFGQPPHRLGRERGLAFAAGSRWWHPGASLDMDFARGRIHGAPSFASALSVTRASAGYAQRADGTWQLFAPGEPRITDKGLLIEEARSNRSNNNAMVGAVIGNPGSMPYGWFSNVVPSGVYRDVVGLGTVDGMDYIDIRLSGTAASSGEMTIGISTGGNVTTTQGENYTASTFLQIIGGSLNGIQSGVFRLRIIYYNGDAYLSDSYASHAPTDKLARYAKTNATPANATRVSSAVTFQAVSGQAISITFRIAWPQLELGAFMTSPIRTTGSAATRAADVITVNNPANYVSMAQGSAFAEYREDYGVAGGAGRALWGIRDSATEYIRGFASDITTAGRASFIVVSGGNNQTPGQTSVNSIAAGNIYKQAVRWAANDCAMRVSAALGSPSDDNSAVMPVGTPVIGVGQFGGGGQYLNGYLRRLALFQTPQNDAQLEALVA